MRYLLRPMSWTSKSPSGEKMAGCPASELIVAPPGSGSVEPPVLGSKKMVRHGSLWIDESVLRDAFSVTFSWPGIHRMGWDVVPLRAGEPVADTPPEPIVGELMALRGWDLQKQYDGRWLLESINQALVWDSPTMRADKVPSRANRNGIYATKDTSSEYLTIDDDGSGAPRVVGVVALSGVVVEGSSGFRGEVCTIRELWLSPPAPFVVPPEIVAHLEAVYQCPVSVPADLEACLENALKPAEA